VVHPQRARAAVHVDPGVHAGLGLHRRNELDRRAGRIGKVQGTTLKRHLDEARRHADAVEMRLGAIEVLIGEDAKADPLAQRLAGGPLEREAVVAALLHAAQPDRVGVLVAHDQAHDLDVEVAARGEVARREHEVARARDVERRIEIGLRDRHLPFSCVDKRYVRAHSACVDSKVANGCAKFCPLPAEVGCIRLLAL
jgi:hypothetical protein